MKKRNSNIAKRLKEDVLESTMFDFSDETPYARYNLRYVDFPEFKGVSSIFFDAYTEEVYWAIEKLIEKRFIGLKAGEMDFEGNKLKELVEFDVRMVFEQ